MTKDKMELLFCASNCLVILRAICHAFDSCCNTWKLRHRENILVFQSPRTLSGGVRGNARALSPDPVLSAIIPYDPENALGTSVSVGLDSFWNNTCENKH